MRVTGFQLFVLLALVSLLQLAFAFILTGVSVEIPSTFSGITYSFSLGAADMVLFLLAVALPVVILFKLLDLKESFEFKVSRKQLGALLIFIALAFALEMPNIGAYPNGIDEGVHALAGYFVQVLGAGALRGPAGLQASVTSLQANYPNVWAGSIVRYAPVYNLASGLFMTVFGITNFASRIFPVLCGVGLSLAAYFLLKEFGVRQKPLLLLGAAATFTMPTVYAWSGRPLIDITLAFFMIASFLQLMRSLKKPSTINWMLFGILCGLGFLTKVEFFMMPIPFAFFVLKDLYEKRDYTLLRGVLIAALVSLALAFPWNYLSLFKSHYLEAVWMNPEMKAMINLNQDFAVTSPLSQLTAWGWQMGFAVALFLGAVVVDLLKRPKIDRFPPLFFSAVWLLVFTFVIGSVDVRHTFMVTVPLLVYSLTVLSKFYSRRLLYLLLAVIVANSVLGFGLAAQAIVMPYDLGYMEIMRVENAWPDVGEYLAANTEGTVLADIATPIQFYLITHGEGRTVLVQDASRPDYLEHVRGRVESENVAVIVEVRPGADPEPRLAEYSLLKTFRHGYGEEADFVRVYSTS